MEVFFQKEQEITQSSNSNDENEIEKEKDENTKKDITENENIETLD